MKLTELLLGELEREAPASRRILERVPEGRFDWKPHEKSMPLGYLATLVATMPAWIDAMVNQDELDFAPKEPSGYKPPELRTSRDLVEAFDAALGKGRGALQGTTDAHLMTSWKLLAGGRVVQEQPRYIAIADSPSRRPQAPRRGRTDPSPASQAFVIVHGGSASRDLPGHTVLLASTSCVLMY